MLSKAWSPEIPEPNRAAMEARASWIKRARPYQLTPDGDWGVWLLLAGRGWGKTLTGAEDVAWFGQTNPGSRIAIIAPTYADARDTCVEGESGLLGFLPVRNEGDPRVPIIPRICIETWNRSMGELVLVNGTRYKLFGTDEPDRLRGPQHTRCWCLTENTTIDTGRGQKQIEHIVQGDVVWTRAGLKRVLWAGMTNDDAEVWRVTLSDGRFLDATPDHPVWVEDQGFIPVEDIAVGDAVCVGSVSSGAGFCGTATRKVTTKRGAGIRLRISGCIEKFGKRSTGLSPRDLTCTTLTKTYSTIKLLISNFFHMQNTGGGILLGFLNRIWLKLAGRGWRSFGKSAITLFKPAFNVELSLVAEVVKQAEALRRVVFVPVNVLKNTARTLLFQSKEPVFVVVNASSRRKDYSDFVQSFVTPKQVWKSSELGEIVSFVVEPFKRRKALDVSVQNSALTTTQAHVVRVEKLPTRQKVYNLTVEDEHEFFANGILVHNCDELGSWRYAETWDQMLFGLRLGQDPRVIVTTTPKPIPLIKSIERHPRTIVTRGSTFDNAANLAPAALEQLKEKYEGTRLGRQELHAEILDEAEGALWTRDMLERARAKKPPPQMRRVVIGVDPAISSKSESNLTGIVAAGIGIDGRGYVLADASGKYTPDGWANKVIALFRSLSADRIIAEGNQGGDMVRHTIQSVMANAPVTIVHASRGKQARAEPIAALYEQGKITHSEAFSDLEDELVCWEPLGDMPSPDRLDALVWAFTALFINAPPRPQFGSY